MQPLARQTSSSPYILPIFRKTGWAGYQSFLCILSVLALIKPRRGRFSAHSTHVQCLTAYRTCVSSPHRSRTQNCEKTRFARSEVKGLVPVKIEKCNYYSFVTSTMSFSRYLEVFEAHLKEQKVQEVMLSCSYVIDQRVSALRDLVA